MNKLVFILIYYICIYTMNIGIYKITSPKGRIYIGSSKNITKRFKDYQYLNCKSQTRLYNSFIKYGVDNHIFEIITECDIQEMLSMELHWGLFYNVLDRKAGLNSKLPKNNENYNVVSNETKDKISKSLTGRVSPMKGKKTGKPAWNKGLKLNGVSHRKGKKLSKESKKKMSLSSIGQVPWNKGISPSNKTREKLSKALKGREVWNKGIKWSEESKKKMSISSKGSIPANRKIILDELTGVFYLSITEASQILNMKRRTLQAMLTNQNPNKTSLIYA